MRRTTLGLALNFAFVSACAAASADSLEQLRTRLRDAEATVVDLKSRIAAMEAGMFDPREEEKARTWFIHDMRIADINSVGGVSIRMEVRNPTKGQTIKYLRVKVSAFNAVHDPIRSELDLSSTARLEYTGPLAYGADPDSRYWANIWYSYQAKCVRVDAIEVVYVSGKVANFDGSALARVMNPALPNRCSGPL